MMGINGGLLGQEVDPMVLDADLTAGWRYVATLQLRTPLACLERDGEFSPGPHEPNLIGPAVGHLPDGRGFNPYGIWVREIDYKCLGFEPPAPGQRATEWGPVGKGAEQERSLLSFLKSFRVIVEMSTSLDETLCQLASLSVSSPENQSIWGLIKREDPGFPDSFFIADLEVLPGVGPAMAEKLYRSGFRTVEEVRSAPDSDLLSISGLGKGLLQKIRLH